MYETINSTHLEKNFISGTIFEAIVGYVLDSITKGKRFQKRESTPVKISSFIHILDQQTTLKMSEHNVLRFHGESTGDKS